jgi:hypothetical protein
MLTLAVLGIATAVPLSAQKMARAPVKGYVAPRTQDGKPDLQGVWGHNAVTPLERPKQLGDKATFTDAELKQLMENAKSILDQGDAQFGDDLFDAALAAQKGSKSYDPTTGNYDQSWMVDRTWDHRTSLIVDPPDGRVPPLTDAAKAREAAKPQTRVSDRANSWEDRGLSERCITYSIHKLIRPGYNSYMQIIQNKDTAVVVMEMIHDARIIPLDGRPHVGKGVGQYLGDSRGHWDGDTLVVETTNFSSKADFRGSSDGLKVTERFTRTGPETLEYKVTYEDPTTWTKPWTVVVNMEGTKDKIYEYACHEGNHSLYGILAGAREQEKRAAAAARSSQGPQ